MKTPSLYLLAFEPFRLWSAFAWKAGEMMMASAQVIGYRSAQMLPNGKSAGSGNGRELALMGQEKIAAGMESGQAIAFDSVKLGQQLGTMAYQQMMRNMSAFWSLSTSRTFAQAMDSQARIASNGLRDSAIAASQLSRSGARAAGNSLKPIHARATANARRLGKKRTAR